MKYLEAPPSARLERFVKCFWSLDSDGGDPGGPEPVVPDGSVEIIFNMADRFERLHIDGRSETQPANIVAGQMRRHVMVGPSGKVNLFGVRFLPAGAFAFFDFSMRELTDRIEDLDAIWGSRADVIADRLYAAGDFRERVAVMEDGLARRMLPTAIYASTVSAAVDAITKQDGMLPVAALAREFGASERSLERQFSEKLGLSPKTFSRIVRFQKVFKMLKSASSSRVEAAIANGYFDQSHMINDFRQFAGLSPAAFLRSSHTMTELFTAGG